MVIFHVFWGQAYLMHCSQFYDNALLFFFNFLNWIVELILHLVRNGT